MTRIVFGICLSLSLALIIPGLASADGGVTFQDVADGDGAGITYRNEPTPRNPIWADFLNATAQIPTADFLPITVNDLPRSPGGMPGVVVFDFDNDGDLDIYATNAFGVPNSLYASQWVETGSLTFIDVAISAGVDATSQDSMGACFGDIDNDGDHDLYVVATGLQNALFENQGDGTFADITNSAGLGNENRNGTACSFADFNNDGLLDITVANTYEDWDRRLAHAIGPTYEFMENNYLLQNQGGNQFADVSAAAGIEDVSNMTGPGLSGGAFTWAIASADYDLDGDVDILNADNQAAPPATPEEDRGYLRLFNNDGAGQFTEVTLDAGLDVIGGWMGLDFGDLNCDGNMDFFATDLGFIGAAPSRWFYGQDDGSFVDPGVGDLGMTPFGWGTSIADYDNDGDGDIIYHGGANVFTLFLADNPGVILQNTGDCSGVFAWDDTAVIKDHRTRMVRGMAMGDLNQDGFEDIVSVSSTDVAPAVYFGLTGPPFFVAPDFGSPFAASARFEAIFAPFPPGFQSRVAPTDADGNVIPPLNGTLSVELNSADNGNNWVEVNTRGSIGTLNNGTVNRDGIGAVVFFTPEDKPTSMRPIIGGSSFNSQDALAANFGLGDKEWGNVDVLWPGGVRNRLYFVGHGEKITFPEIPCSIDTDDGFGRYVSCVAKSVNKLRRRGVLTRYEKTRFFLSAILAYLEEHHS